MTRIFCDRCGKEIAAGPIGYIAVNAKNRDTGDLMRDNEFEQKHFCMECMMEIREFIQRPAGQEQEEDPDQEGSRPDQEGSRPDQEGGIYKVKVSRKRIDIGKIMALKNAGWPNKEIAAEMGMTPAAVANQICKYRRNTMASQK